VPDEFYDLSVELWPIHHRFAAGHRLRLTVASDDYPQVNFDLTPIVCRDLNRRKRMR
jgi:predicted acyl esterase